MDVELTRPMEIDGAQVKKLRMREPTVGDQLASEEFKGGEAAKEIAMLANLCEVSPDDIKRLTLKDYKRLQGAFLGFIA
ncbi:phage tail assembly protein [Microvirga alba]|uniref:phage tail assembly protein n=1 Tax=Microvirga alba TaxID=2791025 RepID=UPI002D21B2F5|nr:phage tail assembly protein [Microvirga alba]